LPTVDFTLDQVKTLVRGEIGTAIKASETRMKRHVTMTVKKSQEVLKLEIIEGTGQLVDNVLDQIDELRGEMRSDLGELKKDVAEVNLAIKSHVSNHKHNLI
jgi:hypothetical protein